MAANAGVVNIHGKEYHTVAGRIARFREERPEYTIETQLISADDERVVMKALIFADKTTVIVDGVAAGESDEQRLIATGYAEEVRSASNINKTSALENCETSAVGRALAFYGLAGTEIASADEVAGAISQQANQEQLEYMALVREFWPSINACKDYLAPKWGENEDQHHVTEARACMKELGDEVYRKLWRAPTKGGCFTTAERKLLKEPPENAL